MNYSNANIKLEYALVAFVVFSYIVTALWPQMFNLLWAAVLFGILPTFWGAIGSTLKRQISIDTFNVFAIVASITYGEVYAGTLIILMLALARLLNAHTESRTRRTIEELLKLKPQTAIRENGNETEEIPVEQIAVGDTLVVEDGSRIPSDGVIIFGRALINESTVTGESVPLEKVVGDRVLSSTLNESGLIKIKASSVIKDSTIERMVELVKEASKNKSRSEKLADRFASVYLPIVLALGAVTYFLTRNISMTAALFLVACADDMAVAIPLAVTATIGKAARRGVVIKGGEWLEVLSKIKTLVVDKTGTLTYGSFAIKDVQLEPGVSEDDLWHSAGIIEKFSNHLIGRTIFKEAVKRFGEPADPEEFQYYKGSGSVVQYKGDVLAIGNFDITSKVEISLSQEQKDELKKKLEQDETTWLVVIKNGKILGLISVGDIPRPQAKKSIQELKKLGVTDIRMFTGDNELVANNIAKFIGIDTVKAKMSPEDKVRELEKIISVDGPVAMIGDGVNDAAALARADVGIAMGSGGAAVSVEAADIVILNDYLSRLPEVVVYSRRALSVIGWDIALWLISNVIGFTLVLTGVVGPTLAAFYNFATDFIPLINSARLFRGKL